jgi:uncharacterized protein
MDLDSLRSLHDSRGPKDEIARFRPISADSHVTEPADMYRNYIDPQFRDRAPHVISGTTGDMFVVEGLADPMPVSFISAAGRDPQDIAAKYLHYEDLYAGGWDPIERLKDQDADGVIAEVIYPSIGMIIQRMNDPILQEACMRAYNRWIVEFCAAAPKRLFAVGQVSARTVASAIQEVKDIKRQGLCGAYLSGSLWTGEDYDDASYDALWATCQDLELPICFHTFGGNKRSNGELFNSGFRGKHKVNGWNATIRDNQDIIGMFIFDGVFDRFPGLKLACVEADAGWAPHFTYRMDHMYMRHRYWQKARALAKLPSEYFHENVWLTFQDDYVAFQTVGLMNDRRLMWANDFPHSDATWPWSHSLLIGQTQNLTDDQKHHILHQNVVDLFRLDI